MNRIRVIHLIHDLGTGGAENGIVNIVNHLDRNRFDSAICSFSAIEEGFEERITSPQCTLLTLGKHAGNDPSVPFKLFRFFRRWRPHVLHTHSWGTLCEGILAGRLARVPVIVHGEHGTIQQQPRNIPIQRFVWGFAKRVLAVSDPHRQRLHKVIGFPEDRILVLENGVDCSRFAPAPCKSQQKIALGFSENLLLIGTVGRLVPVKNQTLLVRAAARLARDFPQMRLLITGEGPLHDDLIALAETLGIAPQVMLLGNRDDIPGIMKALDIFVLPSLNEGMSNTILEAMSTALPVVATNVGGNPEIIDAGRTGMLVNSNHEEQLADTLRLLLVNRETREKLGQAGRAQVEQRYSLTAMVTRYEDLYISLLQDAGRLPKGFHASGDQPNTPHQS